MTANRIAPLAAISAVLTLIVAPPAVGENWPHWRGNERNGVSVESSRWEEGGWRGLKPEWQGQVGEGSSSPVVVDGRLYTLGWSDGRDDVHCLDAATGETLWKTSYACPQYGRRATGDEGIYSGPSSTPEFDGATGYLYTLSVDGDLCCWNALAGGREVWRLNLYDEYDAPRRPRIGRSQRRDYGYTTSPLVYGDWLLVEVGAAEGGVMAFDKRSGKRLWASEQRDPAGHTGGLAPIAVEGVPCAAVLTLYNLVVMRLDRGYEGRTLAAYPWTTEFANNIPTPAVSGQSVIVTSKYNHEAICKLKITLGGAEKEWEQPYASGVCSPVAHEGRIYLVSGRARCLDERTGELVWEGGNFGDAGSCIVTSDERLVLWAGRGDLVLAETAARSPSEFRDLASLGNLSDTDVWPHVVLSAGRLYCKDRSGRLTCFALGGER